MKCPKCGSGELKIQVTFSGHVRIEKSENEDTDKDAFEVTDSESTDSEWTDKSFVECTDCPWTGTVKDTYENKPENETLTVFRKWKNTGDVIALFPLIAESTGCCWSYEHVGQHGGADYQGCLKRTVPATANEYRALAEELKGLGYCLRIRKRFQRS